MLPSLGSDGSGSRVGGSVAVSEDRPRTRESLAGPGHVSGRLPSVSNGNAGYEYRAEGREACLSPAMRHGSTVLYVTVFIVDSFLFIIYIFAFKI